MNTYWQERNDVQYVLVTDICTITPTRTASRRAPAVTHCSSHQPVPNSSIDPLFSYDESMSNWCKDFCFLFYLFIINQKNTASKRQVKFRLLQDLQKYFSPENWIVTSFADFRVSSWSTVSCTTCLAATAQRISKWWTEQEIRRKRESYAISTTHIYVKFSDPDMNPGIIIYLYSN